MIPKEFKLDDDNIWYLDDKDIKKKAVYFNKTNGFYNDNPKIFYLIEGNSDYIIKDTRFAPLFFNKTRIKKMLKDFYLHNNLKSIDLPLAYFKENNKLTGIVVPYYNHSVSIKKIINTEDVKELKKIYNHSKSDYYNIIVLCLEILDIIKTMYDEEMIYLDIHPGNFLLYNNQVKLVDFEPGYVFFTNKKEKYYDKIINGYLYLINLIFRKFKLDNFEIYKGDSFDKVKEDIMKLEKKIKR